MLLMIWRLGIKPALLLIISAAVLSFYCLNGVSEMPSANFYLALSEWELSDQYAHL